MDLEASCCAMTKSFSLVSRQAAKAPHLCPHAPSAGVNAGEIVLTCRTVHCSPNHVRTTAWSWHNTRVEWQKPYIEFACVRACVRCGAVRCGAVRVRVRVCVCV
eukprot:6490677-Amphidinium_carterae.4